MGKERFTDAAHWAGRITWATFPSTLDMVEKALSLKLFVMLFKNPATDLLCRQSVWRNLHFLRRSVPAGFYLCFFRKCDHYLIFLRSASANGNPCEVVQIEAVAAEQQRDFAFSTSTSAISPRTPCQVSFATVMVTVDWPSVIQVSHREQFVMTCLIGVTIAAMVYSIL
jgi:hypothetical protein